jgi:parvulin-like peptidyl-prolyl isomerase
MTKKHHHEQPHLKLSKHAESKIEKQTRLQRIIVLASAIFLGVVVVAVGIGLYVDRVLPMNETILRVNGRSFTLGYYIDTMKLYSQGMDSSQLAAAADSIASQLARDEITRQAAYAEGVVIPADEIESEVKSAELPNNRVTRDLAEVSIVRQALTERIKTTLPSESEQVRFELMLVESRSKATEVEAAVAAGKTLTELSTEYSASADIPVVQDWVPYELLSNKDVAAACQTLDPGKTAVIHDPSAAKNLGYWIIKIVDIDANGAIKPQVILAASLEDAQRAKERLQTEDFAEVAKQYSQIYTMTEDAEFDWVTPEDVVTEAFNAAAFELELNEVSEPILEREIQTTGAYWVVRLLERETRAPYDNVQNALASVAFDEWYSEVSQSAVVENLLTAEQKTLAVQRALS